ncbi:MAG TPA: DNA-3-methyladenine glycosylase [Fulvivirga sp.]|nr:DNA-3-methyladenine glycosylase [Fulvivirga sp.]
MKIKNAYYQTDDVVGAAKDLIGKVLFTSVNGVLKSGVIVETEAYSYKEKACHAYQGKRTNRTQTLFEEGGIAYVYLCYGIHHLFNIVTNERGIAEAVLIRALEPIKGFAQEELNPKMKITSGPGKLSKAMGITTALNRESLTGNRIWLEDQGITINRVDDSPRIGVDYAQEDAQLLWRFTAKDNQWLSGGNK